MHLASQTQPHFIWVHYIDPHGPYQPPTFKPTDFTHPDPLPIDMNRVYDYQRAPGVNDGFEYVDRYDEEIAYMDFEVGRLLDEYKKLGLAENALIIFTADHGESMMEHEKWFTHGYHVYEEIIRVPLLLQGRGFGKSRISTPVSLLDLVPTILDHCNLPVPDGLDGRILTKSPELRDVFSEGSDYDQQWRCVIRDKEKWMVSIDKKKFEPQKQQFFDLEKDPREDNPLTWQEPLPEPAVKLMKFIETDPDPAGAPRNASFGISINAPKVAPGLDEETMNKLRALGYVR